MGHRLRTWRIRLSSALAPKLFHCCLEFGDLVAYSCMAKHMACGRSVSVAILRH